MSKKGSVMSSEYQKQLAGERPDLHGGPQDRTGSHNGHAVVFLGHDCCLKCKTLVKMRGIGAGFGSELDAESPPAREELQRSVLTNIAPAT